MVARRRHGVPDARRRAASFDAVADFSAPFPVEVISTMLGVPKDDRQQIRHWTDLMLLREAGDPKPTHAGMEAGLAQIIYFLELIADKRTHPGDDMITRSPRPRSTATTAPRTGSTTARSPASPRCSPRRAARPSRSSSATASCCSPATRASGRRSSTTPRRRCPRSRRCCATGRRRSTRAASRTSRRRSTARRSPRDHRCSSLTGAANRDEREYDEPDRFDIDREQGLGVGLGHGIHSCLGAALARLESKVAFEELRERWPRYEVDEDGLRRVQMSNVAGFSNVPVSRVA